MLCGGKSEATFGLSQGSETRHDRGEVRDEVCLQVSGQSADQIQERLQRQRRAKVHPRQQCINNLLLSIYMRCASQWRSMCR